MDTLVEIRFRGKFEHYFEVDYEIHDSQGNRIDRNTATLPPCPELVTHIQDWRKAYRATHPRLESVDGFSNSSDINHIELANKVKVSLNNWLNTPEFQPIKEKLLTKLDEDQVILIGIDMPVPELKYIPWCLWDLFDNFPKADYALLRPSFSKMQTKYRQKSKLNVLAIIGDSTGIDTKEDTTVIQALPYVHNLEILNEPSKERVREVLGGSVNTDILFFAGHGRKKQERGEICINGYDTLNIGEIRSVLKKRIKQGLQLSIFNSCDGLKLGEEIADLHIPQAIVMMEAVPDKVAQRFLKSFLKELSQDGVPFVQALRQTRDKLADEDQEYPYAHWLPVLYCNPTEPLLQWPKPNLVQKYPWRSGLAASCLAGLVGLMAVSFIPSMMTKIHTNNTTSFLEQSNKFSYENVELNYPRNWVEQKEFDTPIGGVANFYLKENRNVVVGLFIRKLDQSMTLEDYYNKELATELQSGSIPKTEEATLGAKGGYKVLVSVDINGKRHKKMVVFTLKNNQAYIMVYSAPEELFSSYEPTAQKTVESLKFLDW